MVLGTFAFLFSFFFFFFKIMVFCTGFFLGVIFFFGFFFFFFFFFFISSSCFVSLFHFYSVSRGILHEIIFGKLYHGSRAFFMLLQLTMLCRSSLS